MFKTDDSLVYFALNQWANNIETGDNNYNRNDVIAMMNTCKPGTRDHLRFAKMLKNLSQDQIDLIERIKYTREQYAAF